MGLLEQISEFLKRMEPRQRRKASRFGEQVGRAGWTSRLGEQVGRAGWTSRLGEQVGRAGWASRLDEQVGRAGWASRLGEQVGRAGWASSPFFHKRFSKVKQKNAQNPLKTRSKPGQNSGPEPYTISINPKPYYRDLESMDWESGSFLSLT